MNSEDTFGQNLLMGCRRHQANLMTQHGPLKAVCQRPGKGLRLPCSRKVQSHPDASPEPGRGPHKSLVLGGAELLHTEPSVHTGGWRRQLPLWASRTLGRPSLSPEPDLKAGVFLAIPGLKSASSYPHSHPSGKFSPQLPVPKEECWPPTALK